MQIDSDVLHFTGSLIRVLRVVDGRLRTVVGGDLGVHELSLMGQIDRGVALPSAIARALQIDPARVTRTVDHLANKGYLERSIDQTDRRRCPVLLTESGKRLVRQGRLAIQQAVEDVLSPLDAPERADLLDSMSKLRQALDS